MNLRTQKCDQSGIAEMIAGHMDETREAIFEEHLSQCGPCRDALRDATADQELWGKAGRYLRDENGELCPMSPSGCDSSELVSDNAIVDRVLESLAPTDDPTMLGRIGDYEVSGAIGCGGMGAVLKGYDRSLRRVVAIKVMAPHLANSGAARRRFEREAQAAAAITHDNVIEIFGVSDANGLPYLVMPYVRGPSLQKRIDERGPLPTVELLRIGGQIAAGLAAAHAQGLVHRDIKPANILLSDGVERLVITDFGLARAVDDASVTRSGVIAGTPQYMSPEQARGESVDHRSDLFSLGSVMYALCTGRPPFRAESAYGILRLITDNEPRPIAEINPSIPEWLCAIIAKLNAKQAHDRFASAEEVAKLLEQCLAHVQQPKSTPLPASPLKRSKPFSISRRSIGVIAMIAISLLGLLGVLISQPASPPDISGQWTGEDWGTITLESKQPGTYVGSYSPTSKELPKQRRGNLKLKWSGSERRFSGTWRDGADRAGKISIRLLDGKIRGAWTTKNPGRHVGFPKLGDLSWARAKKASVQIEVDAELGVIVLRGRKPDVQKTEKDLSQVLDGKKAGSNIPKAARVQIEIDPNLGAILLRGKKADVQQTKKRLSQVFDGKKSRAYGAKKSPMRNERDPKPPASILQGTSSKVKGVQIDFSPETGLMTIRGEAAAVAEVAKQISRLVDLQKKTPNVTKKKAPNRENN